VPIPRLAASLLATLLLGCGQSFLPTWLEGDAGKPILGPVEIFRVEDVELDFAGRIDTGAEASAIHATDLELDTPVELEAAAGRIVEFTLENEDGQRRRLSRVVADAVQVRTTHGTETRLRVPLYLSHRGVRKSVLVSLRDRDPMTYKLLVGRDWLGDDFLIDVSREAPER
jgi:hypothetical protein